MYESIDGSGNDFGEYSAFFCYQMRTPTLVIRQFPFKFFVGALVALGLCGQLILNKALVQLQEKRQKIFVMRNS